MQRFAKPVAIGAGIALILVAVAVSPLPLPVGLPVAAVGAVLILRHSVSSRRQFVRLRRRFPRSLHPLTLLLQRRYRKH